jgi:hypothetical protein
MYDEVPDNRYQTPMNFEPYCYLIFSLIGKAAGIHLCCSISSLRTRGQAPGTTGRPQLPSPQLLSPFALVDGRQ